MAVMIQALLFGLDLRRLLLLRIPFDRRFTFDPPTRPMDMLGLSSTWSLLLKTGDANDKVACVGIPWHEFLRWDFAGHNPSQSAY
jgi:hypothetical protein